MAKKLRCYRCGLELSDKEDVYAAYDGMQAWQEAARSRGINPKGILPCKNYANCGGEIVEVVWWRDLIRRIFIRRSYLRGRGK